VTRRWWWPLGPYSILVPVVAIVAVVVGMTWPRFGWPYPLWVQTSAQFHQRFAFAGVIAGTAACWYATVLHAKDRIWVRPGAPRLGAPAVARHLTTLVCWFVGAYLVALCPLVVSTVVHDAVGTPDLLVMVSGVLAMIAATALGYAFGTVVPSIAAVPVVAIGFYALIITGNLTGEPMAAVTPYLWMEPSSGDRESVPLVVFRTALFVAVAVAAVWLAARAMTRMRVRRSLADVAVCLAIPAVLVTIALVRPPVVYTSATPVPSCVERREIRYCVHQDNKPRLDDLVRVVDPFIARFGTKPSNVDEVWDDALFPRFSYPVHGRETAGLEPDGTIWTDVTSTLGGNFTCDWEGEGGYDDRMTRIAELESDVTYYLETGKPSGSLASLTVDEVQEWLAVHQKQLHTCTLTVDQLPGASVR
jgi:hypothetical protein